MVSVVHEAVEHGVSLVAKLGEEFIAVNPSPLNVTYAPPLFGPLWAI